MLKTVVLLCLTFSLNATYAQAQEIDTTVPWYDDFSLWVEEEDADEETISDWYEQISELAEQHIDINTASMEQLLAFPFLSREQVIAIGDHIGRYGFISSAAELLTIPEINYITAQLLSHLVSFDGRQPFEPKSVGERIAMARHEAVGTINIPLYTTYGDKVAYLGPRYKHSLRYTMSLSHHFTAGFVTSQDAGEPFFAGHNRWGYDYVSPFFLVHSHRFFSTVAVGNYRLRTGMGLVVNNNTTFGKTSWASTVSNTRNEIRAHSSRQSSKFFQGVAADMRLSDKLHLITFVSSRTIDATLSKDSTEIRTILTSGYHRTPTEMSHKGIARQTAMGANISYDQHRFHFGATAVASFLSRRLQPDTSAIYRKYLPAGKQFWNASVDYGYRYNALTIEGETATGSCGGIATLNTLKFMPATYATVLLSLRHYSANYSSLFANAFGNNSNTQNETGALLGLLWNISINSSLQFYTDYAYSPKPRYGISAASSLWDTSISFQQHIGQYLLTSRYRVQLRQRDNDAHTYLQNYTDQRLRLRFASDSEQRLQWYLQSDASMNTRDQCSLGLMLTAMGSMQWHRLKLRSVVSWFHTDDYYNRLYLIDGSMRYVVNMSSVYGKGGRASLQLSYMPSKQFTLNAYIVATKYFDRDTIGSSYQRIDGDTKADISLQLVWRMAGKKLTKKSAAGL